MKELLQQAVSLGVLRSLDLQLSSLLAGDEQPLLMLAIAWLSYDSRTGNVCLPLNRLKQEYLFNGRQAELVADIWHQAGEPGKNDWLAVLTTSLVIGDGHQPTPLVLHNDRLYLQRLWLDEGRVAAFFRRQHLVTIAGNKTIKQILADLFPSPSDAPLMAVTIDWQKVAVAVAVSRQVAIISGGPGTGKTTTVARLLASLILLSEQSNLRIALAAPTGKAAARLTGSLAKVSNQLILTSKQRSLIPNEAATLHRLLGIRANNQSVRYHANNPLHLDVLVVDEASMIDLPMMARLIDALPTHARLILLGDRDQLASVETGAVLGDICHFAEFGYDTERAKELSQLTGFAIPKTSLKKMFPIRNSLCLLRKSYRFHADSGIGRFAYEVNHGNGRAALAVFSKGYSDLSWLPLEDNTDYAVLIAQCVAGYKNYLSMLDQLAPEALLKFFSGFQLLCALRHGPFGVEGLNEQIEQALITAGFIHKIAGVNHNWYAGRPVMLSKNNSRLGLYNGDIGLTLYDPNSGNWRVYFQLPDGSIKSVQPNQLPQCETAYAMTVHKSQGSEFDHSLLVLPDSYSPLLTRELIYTASTRARQHLSLFGNESILLLAIKKSTERQTGLVVRLAEGSR